MEVGVGAVIPKALWGFGEGEGWDTGEVIPKEEKDDVAVGIGRVAVGCGGGALYSDVIAGVEIFGAAVDGLGPVAL